jgi:nitrogen fixation-related uncharacterized protein
MDFTWLAILASLAMAFGTALLFIFAVKRNQFDNFEDAKYQVFWSDLEEMVDENAKEGGGDKQNRGTERGSSR